MVLPPAFSPMIRGRDAELAAVGDLLGRVRSGSGAVLLIEGAAGMGKSRLIGEGVRMAQRASVAVGIGAAEPWESVAELAPLLRALFDGPEPLLDRAGLSSLHAAPELRYWRLQELQSLLEGAAMAGPSSHIPGRPAVGRQRHRSRPAHAASRVLPHFRSDGSLRCALISVRASFAAPSSTWPMRVRKDSPLEPLSLAAVAQVARDVMQAEPDESVLRMAGQAGGNPFLLVELLEGLRAGGPGPSRRRACDADRRPASRPSQHEYARAPGPHVRFRPSGGHGGRVAGAGVFRLGPGDDARSSPGVGPDLSRGADRGRHRDRARRPARPSSTI